MTFFEYIIVLVSIIIGLGITNILGGLARFAQYPNRGEIYWVHVLWAIYCFLLLIFFWWWEFSLITVKHWFFTKYLFVVGYATLSYLLCAVLFPPGLEGDENYSAYFLSRRTWFFGLLALIYVVDIGDTLLKGSDYFQNLGWQYPLRNFVHVVACLIAIRTSNRAYHGGFAVLALVDQLRFIVSTYQTLPVSGQFE